MIPSAWAVLRLMISWNFMGYSTGKSAGLVPCRILSTIDARAAVSGRRVRSIGHEPARLHKPRECRRSLAAGSRPRVPRCVCGGDLTPDPPAYRAHRHARGPARRRRAQGRSAGSRTSIEVQVEPQRLCRRLELRERYAVEGMVRGDEHGHAGGGWHHLLEQLELFPVLRSDLSALSPVMFPPGCANWR